MPGAEQVKSPSRGRWAWPSSDLSYHRDKYLIIFCAITLFLSMGFFTSPELGTIHVFRGTMWLIVAVLLILLSSRKLLILGGGLAIIAIRAAVAVVTTGHLIAWLMLLGCGFGVYAILHLLQGEAYESIPDVQYSYVELAIDFVVVAIGLVVVAQLSRLFDYLYAVLFANGL